MRVWGVGFGVQGAGFRAGGQPLHDLCHVLNLVQGLGFGAISIYLCIYISLYLSLSIYLFTHLYIYLSIYLSIYVYIYITYIYIYLEAARARARTKSENIEVPKRQGREPDKNGRTTGLHSCKDERPKSSRRSRGSEETRAKSRQEGRAPIRNVRIYIYIWVGV